MEGRIGKSVKRKKWIGERSRRREGREGKGRRARLFFRVPLFERHDVTHFRTVTHTLFPYCHFLPPTPHTLLSFPPSHTLCFLSSLSSISHSALSFPPSFLSLISSGHFLSTPSYTSHSLFLSLFFPFISLPPLPC